MERQKGDINTSVSSSSRHTSSRNPIRGAAILPVPCNQNPTAASSFREADEQMTTDDSYMKLPDGAKFIEKGPCQTPLFEKKMPDEVHYITQLTLDAATSCIWRTPKDNTVMIGGDKWNKDGGKCVPMILVVDNKYNITSHELTAGEDIVSGECINMELSLVHASFPSARPAGFHPPRIDTIFTARIEVNSSIPTTASPVGKLIVDNPSSLFRFSKNKFGVLCMYPSRIEIFKLISLLTDKNVKSAETILLGDSCITEADYFARASVTPDSYIWVNLGNEVNVYNNGGDKLKTYNIRMRNDEPASAGAFYRPTSVQCGEDGRLLVCCLRGDMHLYDGHNWKLMKQQRRGMEHSVVTEDIFWAICNRKVFVYKINCKAE